MMLVFLICIAVRYSDNDVEEQLYRDVLDVVKSDPKYCHKGSSGIFSSAETDAGTHFISMFMLTY